MGHSFSNGITIAIAPDNASYSIRFPELTLKGCKIALYMDDTPRYATGLSLHKGNGKAIISAQSELGPVDVEIRETTNGAAPAIELTASIELPKGLRRVHLAPLANVELNNATHLLCHGNSMGGCRSCKLPAHPASETNQETEEPGASFESHFQTIVSFPKGKLHFGQPLLRDNITVVQGKIDGSTLHDVSAMTTFEFPAEGIEKAEPLTLAVVQDGFKALTDWGDAHATVPPPDKPQPIGWNSWDYYRWSITEDEVLANADFIAADPVLSKYVKRIIIDDGWQYCYGEWDANCLFPSGMDALAKRLRKMGFTPGLWFCPAIVEPHSRIAQWESDRLALSEGGDPALAFDGMRRKGFILDPTLKINRQWWHDLFSHYADIGYGYFKIDFLTAVYLAPRFHNHVPRGQLMRRIVQPISEALRGRATLLGCSYGYDAGNDLVRIVRAGSDIHATWNCTRANAVTLGNLFWASNRLWTTDPDFCVCRGPETSKDPKLGKMRCLYVFVDPKETRRGPAPDYPWSHGLDTILYHEAQCLLSLAIMNGGALNLSDKLPVLNERGLDLLRRTVSASRGSAPLPVDLFETDIASKWLQRTPTGFRVLLVNWDDEDKKMVFDFGPYGYNGSKARNFWTDECVEIHDNTIRAVVRGHGCLMLEF